MADLAAAGSVCSIRYDRVDRVLIVLIVSMIEFTREVRLHRQQRVAIAL